VTVPSDLHGHPAAPQRSRLDWGPEGADILRGTAERRSVSAHCAAPEQPHSSHTRNQVPHFTPDSGRGPRFVKGSSRDRHQERFMIDVL
jgi:hypothetical protein